MAGSTFEAAVDAIVAGDAATLHRLLREQPDLVRARSTREHGATLLHYTAANGVENERQKTPPNIVAIARMLLDAGAEVDSGVDMYGGRCTTLGLAATSVWPELAGVQDELMQLLIDRGALIDGPRATGRSESFIGGCFANGRAAAAEYLAAHGARINLDGAAGLGRLDLVAGFFSPDGTLKPPATVKQLHEGLHWACQYGRIDVVRFLLDRGVPVATASPTGSTLLHAAALGGHGAIVALLLERGAAVDVVERSFDGTPLHWALHGWSHTRSAAARDGYYEVIARLVRAGAAINPAWLDDAAEHTAFASTLRADPRMVAALNESRTSNAERRT